MGRASLGVSWLLWCALLGGCPEDGKPADETDAGRSPEPDADAEPSADAEVDLEMDAGGGDARVFDAGDLSEDAAPAADAQPDARPDARSDAAVVPFVCNVQAPTSCPDPAPKFADVQPIFTARCAICHGQDWTGEWPLDSYTHIADWQAEIRAELVACTMPPPDAGVPIPDDERDKILSWLRCGLPK